MRREIGDVVGAHGGDVDRADLAAALDQPKNRALAGEAGLAALRALGHDILVAEVGFIGFDDLAGATQSLGAGVTQGLAQPMRHEPRRLVADAQHAVELVSADTFLAGAQQVHGVDPLVQRNLGTLQDGADGDRELLTAGVALDDTIAVRNAVKPGDTLDFATVRANRPVGPVDRLQMLTGSVVIEKGGVVHVAHGIVSCSASYRSNDALSR